jgi:hypothetical protein
MKTLDEAIEHCKDVAKQNERKAIRNRNHGGYVYEAEARICEKCAMEHQQLAEWLEELKERRENENA